jgi:plasmid maintenance system killer protein
MLPKIILFACAIFSILTACTPGSIQDNNPPAPGFNIEASDHQAIIIADEVMEAMGGRKAWDETRYLQWNFFGRRKHTWDKQTGDVRIESLPDSTIYLVNVNTMQGKVKRGAVIETDPDTLTTLLNRAKSIWINDSYWLVMPFKLKDSGVTLKHTGPGLTLDGKSADVLQLTFEKVGDTPQNKYLVSVDEQSKLVTQWSYFENFNQVEPNFTLPWTDYQQYGKILLSGGRGERQITEIAAPASLPPDTFTKFD